MHLLSCSYVRNFTAELGMMRTQLVQLPLNMPLMPSSFDIYLSPCMPIHPWGSLALDMFLISWNAERPPKLLNGVPERADLPDPSVHFVFPLHLHQDLESLQGSDCSARPAAVFTVLSICGRSAAQSWDIGRHEGLDGGHGLGLGRGLRGAYTPPATPPATRDFRMLCHDRLFAGFFSSPLPPFSLALMLCLPWER